MFGMKQRFWYIARDKREKYIAYVITATSLKNAIKSLGAFAELHEVIPVTWSRLTSLLHCEKPDAAKITDTACGDLLIKKGGHTLAVRVGR